MQRVRSFAISSRIVSLSSVTRQAYDSCINFFRNLTFDRIKIFFFSFSPRYLREKYDDDDEDDNNNNRSCRFLTLIVISFSSLFFSFSFFLVTICIRRANTTTNFSFLSYEKEKKTNGKVKAVFRETLLAFDSFLLLLLLLL